MRVSFPADYAERVYAGILGKMIGVYLGRPIEGWPYERIMAEIGDVDRYIHERRGVPLIVTDDDLSGTFTFVRAVEDYAATADTLTPAQVGQTWLNYLIEGRTILWWGGVGNSTEHTAYLRLKQGLPAPASGAIATNGQVVAEQIGAQIFIDSWAMLAPGDPALAADLARRAASVSHDGAAVHAAQALAAMEALAFVERDTARLLDAAAALIPADSIIRRLIDDLRAWHAAEPDWRRARERIAATYGYDRYGGNCHVVPNHALILLGLLYGRGDFRRSLCITTTAGWDTDCNAANLGCLLGIQHGLAAIDSAPDLREPLADRLYLPTADGGRAISDAVIETDHLVRAAYALSRPGPPSQGGWPPPDPAPPRFHFGRPGSRQGFVADPADAALLTLHNPAGAGLGVRCAALPADRPLRISTATFIPPEARQMPGSYELLACPTLYPGQIIRAELHADPRNQAPVACALFLRAYDAEDTLATRDGPAVTLAPGARQVITWPVPDVGGQPIAAVGVVLGQGDRGTGGQGDRGIEARGGAGEQIPPSPPPPVPPSSLAPATVTLTSLGWDGEPDVRLGRPAEGGTLWRRAWVDGTDQWDPQWPEAYRPVQNRGRGLIIQGTRAWRDYQAEATITPHLAESWGLAVRVQGMARFYALLLTQAADGLPVARLVKALDGDQILAEAPFAWAYGTPYSLRLAADGAHLIAHIDGAPVLSHLDQHRPLSGGAVALVVSEGRVGCEVVSVKGLRAG